MSRGLVSGYTLRGEAVWEGFWQGRLRSLEMGRERIVVLEIDGISGLEVIGLGFIVLCKCYYCPIVFWTLSVSCQASSDNCDFQFEWRGYLQMKENCNFAGRWYSGLEMIG